MKLTKSIKNTKLNNEDDVEALIDAYKEAYLDLKQQISRLRKEQKNPIIPDLMSRKIPSKIKYAEVSKSTEDLGKAEIAILETIREIQYCDSEEVLNVKEEISEKYKEETMTKEEREKEQAEI